MSPIHDNSRPEADAQRGARQAPPGAPVPIYREALRIMDFIEGRPALSRWHKDYRDAFAEFMKQDLVVRKARR